MRKCTKKICLAILLLAVFAVPSFSSYYYKDNINLGFEIGFGWGTMFGRNISGFDYKDVWAGAIRFEYTPLGNTWRFGIGMSYRYIDGNFDDRSWLVSVSSTAFYATTRLYFTEHVYIKGNIGYHLPRIKDDGAGYDADGGLYWAAGIGFTVPFSSGGEAWFFEILYHNHSLSGKHAPKAAHEGVSIVGFAFGIRG
jgi:hypothetical protein